MNALIKLIAPLLLAMLPITAFAITDDQVFAYAEANYSTIFTGKATAGQYKQYNYRYYPTSGNYLAVDTSGVISIFGPYTGNVMTPVGPKTLFADIITAWEATRNVSFASIAGTWKTSQGDLFTISSGGKMTGLTIGLVNDTGWCYVDGIDIHEKTYFTIQIQPDLSFSGSTSEPYNVYGYGYYSHITGEVSDNFITIDYTSLHREHQCDESGGGTVTATKQ